jgi:hypothetical protein
LSVVPVGFVRIPLQRWTKDHQMNDDRQRETGRASSRSHLMRTTRLNFVAVAGSVVLLACPSLRAHHSFAAVFDVAKPVRLTGTVTSVEWTNPHAHIRVNVAGPGGLSTAWYFELGTPNALMRGGWLRNSLRPGDTVTVNGYAARDGSHFANARSVITSVGRTLFARSSFDEAPTK